MTELRQDIRYTLRLLRRTPGFTAVAIATLALGIGASTAIFTIVDVVLLRPLTFAEPQRLTMIRPTSGSRVSPAYLHDWRLGSRAFRDMAGWDDVRANLTGEGEPLEVLADRVTTNFFTVLGARALLGRTFTVGADSRDVEREVDPRVTGSGSGDTEETRASSAKSITLDGESFTIIGVMPEGFTIRTTELSESRAELWMPFRLVPRDRAGMGGFLNVVARLAPGVARQQAQAELSVIARRIEEAHPSYSRDWGVNVVPLHDATVKDVRLALLVLLGAVGILLLIACANVANLMLEPRRITPNGVRDPALARRHSDTARCGSSLTESLVLAALGGALGVLLAAWGTEILVSVLPAGLDLPRTREIGVDLRILVFAVFVTFLTAILFGLVPSFSSARSIPQSALREATRGSPGGGSRNRLGSMLIISEVALALILLAGAGVLGRSFRELSRVNPGFRTEQVLTLRTTLPSSRYETNDRIRAFSDALLERIEHLPGIRAVGSVNYLPMSRFGAANCVSRSTAVPRRGLRTRSSPGSASSGGATSKRWGFHSFAGAFPVTPTPRRHSPSSSSTRNWHAATGRARIRSAAASPGAGVRMRGSRVKSSAWSEACAGPEWPEILRRLSISGSPRTRAGN